MDDIKTTYDKKYFTFTKLEREIQPGETIIDLEAYDESRRRKELLRCSNDFAYFCNKYVKISHPVKGLIPLVLYNHQRRAIQHVLENRFASLIKPRQMGLSVLFQAWGLWRGLFRWKETIMVLHAYDRFALCESSVLKTALKNLPSWMKPELIRHNDHEVHFADSETKILNYTWQAACGRAIDWLILDEAPRHKDVQREWNAVLPTIATGGRCVAFGSLGAHLLWWDMVTSQKNSIPDEYGDFRFVNQTLSYREHPDYDSDEWAAEVLKNMGQKTFRCEVLCQLPEQEPKKVTPKVEVEDNSHMHLHVHHHHHHYHTQSSNDFSF
jgi:hypothetical protein